MTDPNKRKDDREPQKVNKQTLGNQGNEAREIGVEKPGKMPDENKPGKMPDESKPEGTREVTDEKSP